MIDNLHADCPKCSSPLEASVIINDNVYLVCHVCGEKLLRWIDTAQETTKYLTNIKDDDTM